MRRAGLLVVATCAAVAVGCLTSDPRPTVPAVVQALASQSVPEGLIVESVLIEQPVGDPFLDRELWSRTLAAGAPETRALLTENGLRVGILAGSVPQKLQTLLESEGDTVSPQRLTFHLRKDAVIPTAGPLDSCKFSVLTDLAGVPKPVELRQARCGVCVKPRVTTDGRVALWCEPQLQHGDRREWFRPNEDGTQFSKYEEMQLERYAGLAFEATLRPDDYLLVGSDAGQPGTLGAVMFGVELDGRPRQRVLALRARQARPQEPSDLPAIGGPLKRPSPAAQAGARRAQPSSRE